MHRPPFGLASGLVPANPAQALPRRAVYYFPWFDEGWEGVQAMSHYTPAIGANYDQNDPEVIAQHLQWIKYAGIDTLICVWRGYASGFSHDTFTANGPHQYGTDAKLAVILDQCLQVGLKACILYEVEAYADPTAAEIAAEFAYLAANRWNHPAYLRVDDRPVVFVYTGANASNAMSSKYSTATSGFTTAYMMLQTSTTASTTPNPDGFFTFTSNRTSSISNSYTILPGFWRGDSGTPVTTRNLTTWASNIASMVASGKDWQIIISWNEWGEGSMIEPTEEFGTDYIDALAAA